MTIKSIAQWFKKNYKIFGLFLAIVISVLIFVYRDSFIHLQNYGYLGLFVLSVIGNATIILPAPVVLAAFVGGGIFNPVLVSVVVALGASIGELTGYVAGFSGSTLVTDDAKFNKIKKWMDKYGLWTIFVLAAIPNPLFDLAGIVSGAMNIKVHKYLIVVFLGKLIKFGIFAFLGAGSVGLIEKYL